MGNRRFSTKPTKPVEPKEAVRRYVQGVLHGKEVRYGEEWVWQEQPTFSNPCKAKVTFYGHNRFQAALAQYEGPYGIWTIDLAPLVGAPSEERIMVPCKRVWGSARCLQASDEWKMSMQERIKKLVEQGLL